MERQRTAAHLGQAFTQGYLSMEEYETRLGQAYSAQTAGTLSQLASDLPVEQIALADPRRRTAVRRDVQIHVVGYLVMAVLMIGIWLAVGVAGGSWYFWPIWPILGVGLGVVSRAIRVPMKDRLWPI